VCCSGVVDANYMDHKRCLSLAKPCECGVGYARLILCADLGKVYGVFTDWKPTTGRGELFPETVDAADPWQFTYGVGDRTCAVDRCRACQQCVGQFIICVMVLGSGKNGA
jgi:hypothetical protein